MSELNLIKTVLFNAADLNEALTRLTEIGVEYSHSDIFNTYSINSHDLHFWASTSARCPLAVFIRESFVDYDERLMFLAGQRETVETPVPAASPENAGQRLFTCEHCGKTDFDDATGCISPVVFSPAVGDFICGFIPEQSTASVDKNRPTWLIKPYAKHTTLRAVIRIERRLRNSQAKGLSS